MHPRTPHPRTPRPRTRAALGRAASLLLMLAAAALAACAGGDAGARDGRPRVLASTAIIGEFARRVVGDAASVTVVIPSGVAVESYEPTPDVARRVAAADIVFVNGYRLEAAVLDVIVESRSSGAPLVVVSEGIPLLDGSAPPAGDLVFARGDPHMWLDVANAVRYVERIRDAMVTLDPAHAAGYRERAAAYVEELRALNAELAATLEAIREPQRRVIVFHDAFRYFTRAFRLELVAAVSPAGPAREPNPQEVANIVRLVRREGVPAIFREPQFSSRILDLVAEETGVRVLTLYSVPVEGEAGSYAEMMRANARALVEGLGG